MKPTEQKMACRKTRRIATLLSLLLPCALWAQSTNATLTGFITDQSKAAMAHVKVDVINMDTNIHYPTMSNGEGSYTAPNLPPGNYKMEVEKQGFKSIVKPDIPLHVQDVIAINFTMAVGSTSESVTVEGGVPLINTESAAVSTVVDRQFVANTPLNGRSFQSLIQLAPGVATVPGALTNAVGEFSVNGQRREANYYIVDGVSANTGVTGLNYVGATPAETALGTTQSLVSVDALQEFRISTSTYSAEYGRTPGAQISFQTRSGTNEWHSSAFDFLRNDALDANNWFNNASGLSKTAERQNDFGGTLGGPLVLLGLYNGKDKTFFFFSYEGLRLRIPQPAYTTSVPNMSLRQNSPEAVQAVLDAFPLPNGADQGNGLALFTGSYSSPSSLDASSIRVDHVFGNSLRVFDRYADTPSDSISRYIPQNFATLINNSSTVKTATLGVTMIASSRLVNDLRFNYTSNDNGAIYSSDNFAGATPLSTQAFAEAAPAYSSFTVTLSFGTRPSQVVRNTANEQHQWNVTDTSTYSMGRHTLKFGIDYRRQVTTQGANQLVQGFTFASANQILSNVASSGYVQTYGVNAPIGTFDNFSSFVQDEWKTTRRLHLSLGLRWDFNPPPTGKPQPYTLDQIADLSTSKLAPAGTSLYSADYKGFAPRVGVSYELSQKAGYETVVRSGFGVFYDIGNQAALYGIYGGVGIGSYVAYPNVSFPFTPVQQAVRQPSTASPYNSTVSAPDPHLRLPYTLQWNAAIQQGLGHSQTLTVSYVAAGARELLHNTLVFPSNNPNFSLGNGLTLLTNGATSNYNSLQLQLQRQLARGLQVLASYTWSHSIDDLSSSSNFTAPLLRGNSDFDVRHNFTAALGYNIPALFTGTTFLAPPS
jgi:hypothetical protein